MPCTAHGIPSAPNSIQITFRLSHKCGLACTSLCRAAARGQTYAPQTKRQGFKKRRGWLLCKAVIAQGPQFILTHHQHSCVPYHTVEMRHKEWKMGTMVERIQPVGPEDWGPKEGGNATSPLHSRRSPTKGTKSEIKTYARGHHDAPSISKYGSLVQPDTQIGALR